jgi:integrase
MLTDATIRKALKQGIQKTLSDGSGRGTGRLVLMIRGSSAEWYAQHWHHGKRKLSKIGSYPSLSLSEARELFRNPPEQVKAGGSVGELFEDYVSHLQKAGKRSAENVGLTLARVAAGLGAGRPANSITTADVTAYLRSVYARGAVSMADHMRSYVRSAYGWAIKSQNDYRTAMAAKYAITVNPATDIPTEPKVPGERWLNVEELRTLWRWSFKGTEHTNRNTNPRNLLLLRLLMLTGQRVEELIRLRADMLDWELKTITWERTKTGGVHVLPMCPIVQSVLRSLTPNECGLLFPSDVIPSQPITDQTVRKMTVYFLKETGLPHFSPRDLRRTWKTIAGKAGLTKSERDLIQNHAAHDVSSRHYDRYDYLTEKRAAVEKWSEWFRVEIERAP